MPQKHRDLGIYIPEKGDTLVKLKLRVNLVYIALNDPG